MAVKRVGLLVVVVVAWWAVGGTTWAADEWKTPEAKKAWLTWDRDVGDALQGRGDQPELQLERCQNKLWLQGYAYRDRLNDWERRRADPELSFGTSAFPPDTPKPQCRAPMF